MAYLILVRHGRSEWNEKGLWTGFADPPLSKNGREEIKKTAQEIKDIPISIAFCAPLERMRDSVSIILAENGLDVPVHESGALKERDYGIYTGKNKWEVQKELGTEAFLRLRRGWNEPIPEGESLKQVYERIVPYYEMHIVPHLKNGESVLVVGGGNVLRSLIKHLENVFDDKIVSVEIWTGEAWIYQVDSVGAVLSKETRARNEVRV